MQLRMRWGTARTVISGQVALASE